MQTVRLRLVPHIHPYVKAQADNSRFSGSAKFSLRGDGTAITLGSGTIGIDVPLTLNLPDGFDADMSIDLQLAMASRKPLSVVVTRTSVSVNRFPQGRRSIPQGIPI